MHYRVKSSVVGFSHLASLSLMAQGEEIALSHEVMEGAYLVVCNEMQGFCVFLLCFGDWIRTPTPHTSHCEYIVNSSFLLITFWTTNAQPSTEKSVPKYYACQIKTYLTT